LRIPGIILLRVLWGGFLLFTSIYCFLAFLPFTYASLIKAPPYDWIPWFVSHHAGLYWIALVASALAYGPILKSRAKIFLFSLQVLVGLYVLARPILGIVQPDWPTYFWSLVPLVLLISIPATQTWQYLATQPAGRQTKYSLDYSTVALVAMLMAILWAAGAQLRRYSDSHTTIFSLNSAEVTGWSIISHVLVALLLLSALNLIFVMAARTPWPKVATPALCALFVFGILWFMLDRFLGNALGLDGWPAQLYAASLSAALTLWAFSLAIPLVPTRETPASSRTSRMRKPAGIAIALAFGALLVALPSMIQGGDWDGVIQHTVAFTGWIVLGACAYAIRPPTAKYSVAAILGVALLAGFSYKTLQATAIYWAKPLGKTDDEFARTFENYAVRDASFDLANHVLGNGREKPCDDLCRILREYTNIPNFPIRREVNLVERLIPAQGNRPNIFIFVIDSMRPDYLGAYNSKVDFTPSLDAFARDSVVMRRGYTQYAGTSLSEPAIWAGTMLLHDHDLAAFSKINSLEKLGKVDGYREMVSYDPVASQFLSPSDDLVKLDTDKIWNQFEVCSTIQQTEAVLDRNAVSGRPVLFYSQPMNVHQFAHNHLPRMTDENWQRRPGFINRIAYEVHGVDQCLGGFFTYLKHRNLYDNSIIVVTADHGDATGDFGRYSHSTSIYPEIMRVPIIIHLPKKLQGKVVYDEQALATLTDITPSIYYLLGHRPVVASGLFGHPLFTETEAELHSYRRDDIFFASDVHAVYGLLGANGRYFYATYDSPAQSYLYDLGNDPNGTKDILTPALKIQYDQRIIEHLQAIAGFYGYRPKLGGLLAARN
jgi:Sulfatase